MTREFIMTPEFDKNWSKLGFTDDDLKKLQEEILLNPKIGPVIEGTGGLRKMRFALNTGKSGGARVLYVDFVVLEEVYLITAFPKSDKVNINSAEKNQIQKMIKELKQSAKERRSKK
ncbi:MAG: type II toxin-antitoxin system RelE/ParE family toxin [Clostridia bacterium]|nr:type II toxin-antitoxin system RelE/ParE family toxin [Clostridia bacterium]